MRQAIFPIKKTWFDFSQYIKNYSRRLMHSNQVINQHPDVNPINQSEDFQLTELQKVIDKVGGEGRYQFVSFIIFSVVWFLTAWTMAGQSFFFEDQFTCKTIEDKEQCKEYICSLPPHERSSEIKSYSDSIVFAFDDFMICDQDYLSNLLISIFYFGCLIGFFIIPTVADNFGRKIGMLISWGIFGVGVLVLAFSFHPGLIGIGEFLAGFGSNPAIILCYSFINEQFLRKSRQIYGVGIQVFFAVGMCITGLLFIPDLTWRYVLYLLLGLILVSFISLFYLLETPKFLLGRDKERTLEVLNKMARRNKKDEITIDDIKDISVESKEDGASALDLCRYKSLRSKTFICGFTLFGILAIYYSTLLNLNNAGFDKLINHEIVGASQGIAYFTTGFYISKVKRKTASIVGMSLTSFFCFLLASLDLFQNENNKNTLEIVSFIGLIVNRFFLCSLSVLFYNYIAELFPTRVRSLGSGATCAMGTVGGVFAPYLIMFAEDAGINTWIFPGVLGCIAIIAMCFLTETYGKPLEDEIEEKKKHSLDDTR